jgi:hypothetical protein
LKDRSVSFSPKLAKLLKIALVSYHAAPTADIPMHIAIPTFAQAYGDTLSRN